MWSPNQERHESIKENYRSISTSGHGKWYGPGTPTTDYCSMPQSPRKSPRLSLALFAKTPRVSFGKVKIGDSKVKRVVVENPLRVAQSLFLDKWPEKKGFTILKPVEHEETLRLLSDGTYYVLSRYTEFTVPALSTLDLPILWKPGTEGNFRETITLKLGDINRLQLIVFGNAIDTAVKPKHKMKTLLPEDVRKGCLSSQKRKFSVTDKITTSNIASKKVLQESNKGLPKPTDKNPAVLDTNKTLQVKPTKAGNSGKGTGTNINKRTFKTKISAKGVASSRLTLIKKSVEQSRNVPRHPLPYVARNIYFDEKWMEKQERGFTQWLNYILTPPDELTTPVLPGNSAIFIMEDSDKEHNQPLAPTKEVLSFRTYTAKRKMARLRRSACLLYQSQPVALVARAVEGEVERNRLTIRPDKHFHQDLGIKEMIVKMLLSYNPLWLRIGLETVYGEILPLQSNSDVYGLKRFIKSRFLANPDIAKEYRHATIAECYRPGYFEALAKFTLKKFLMLVLFLDKAKLTRLIDHDPCLFNKEAQYKCSRDILLSFSRDYLKGEGDVTKHLSFLNYTVSHVQAPLDEMDYAVKNLAVDLRDGLRITRVIELLTHNWSLSSNLRVPPISRLQKIHNVGVSLNALKDRGVFDDVKNTVDPRHIVDGHREKTLSFLWMIIFHFQVNLVVNERQIKDEISFLRKYHRLKNCEIASAVDVRCRESTEEQDVYHKSEKLGLLLEWCRAVCRLYRVKVDNFTVSMSDGRVLCYLVHYYHPCLLREEEICQETTQTCNPFAAEDDSLTEEDWFTLHSLEPDGRSRLQELKENERKNHELCHEKVQELGRVPSMFKFNDMSTTIPDEKVVITYVSYLCARLLDLREEGRAARTIQLAWRRHRLEQRAKEHQRKTRAALVIQYHFRSFMEKKREEITLHSTLIIQAFFRGYQARRDLRRRNRAAVVIQSSYRSFVAMQEAQRDYENLKRATLRMQALVRGKISRQRVKRMKAARVMQSYWQRYLARRRFLSVRNSTIILQARVRQFLARRRYKNLKTASVVLQRRYRALILGRNTKRDYTKLKKAVATLQAIRRGAQARRRVARLRAVVVIQKSVRMWRCRRAFLEGKKNIITVQSLARRKIACRRYNRTVLSVRVIQQRWKAYQQGISQRNAYCQLKGSAISIQTFYRTYIARQKFLSIRQAAIVIQAFVRGFLVRKAFEKWRESCYVIQKYFRAYLLMKVAADDFRKKKEAVIKLQAFHRGRAVRSRYLREKEAAVIIQARVRGHMARKQYLTTKSAALVLQTRYRALKAMLCQRKCYIRMHTAIVTLQASLRGHLVRRQLREMGTAATLIQSNYRRHAMRARYLNLQQCVVVIQRRYRACSVGRQIAGDYKKLRNAALVIQKYTRGFTVRKDIKVMSKAAVKIQANYRRYRGKKAYSTLKASAVIIQRMYRSLRLARFAREDYVTKRACVVRLQSVVRRVLCARQFQREKYAARAIQTRWRAVLASRQTRDSYRRIRNSIITIQAFARGLKVRRAVRQERAAIRLQSCWRGFVERRSFLKLWNATVKIQSRCRMLMQRRRYLVLKERVVSLQRLVRANQLCKRQMLMYGIIRGAIITLQAAVRGHRTRKGLREMKKAAVKIQCCFRRYLARREYLKISRNTLLLQRRRRATVISRRNRAEYKSLKQCIILLQSRVRSRAVRRKFVESRKKITHLQAAIRGLLARSRYHRKRKAAKLIQLHYRSYLLGSAVRLKYNIQRGACITLQAYVRGWIFHRRYVQLGKAAHVIQVYHRATIAARNQRCDYLKLRSAAICVQALTRGWTVRRNLKRFRAATSIQSWWKMYVARNNYIRDRQRVVRAQSFIRMWLRRKQYKTLLNAAVTVQQRYRANLICRKERGLFLEKKGSCLLIQHCYRYYRQRYLVMTMLQSLFEIRRAALVIQRRYRANQLMKHTRQSYLKLRSAVITLQAAARGYRARKFVARVRATVIIQSYYRGYRQHSEYTRLINAVIKIQAFTRGKQACIAYRNLRIAAVAIQRRERARVLGISERNIFLKQKKNAVLIQRWFRCNRARRRFLKLKNAVLKTQALARGKQARFIFKRMCAAAVVIQRRERARLLGNYQRNLFLKQRKNTVLIQSWMRCYQEKKRYLRFKQAVIRMQARVRGRRECLKYTKLREAAVVIQRKERARARGNAARKIFLYQRKSAVSIQSWFRGCRDRRQYFKFRNAAVKIQACVRGYCQRRNYVQMQLAAVCIQNRYRAYISGKEVMNRYHQTRNAIITIQSFHRGTCARRYTERLQATITIQTAFRRYKERKRYLLLRNATVYLQAAQRMRRERRKYTELRYFTIQMQKRVRTNQECRRTRTKYQKLRFRVVLLQALYRGWKARENVRRIKSIRVIQKRYRARVKGRRARVDFVRMRMAAVTIQSHYRGHQDRERFKLEIAARTIQAYVRGYQARRNVEKIRRVQEARLLRFSAAVYVNLVAIRLQRAYRKARAIALFNTRMDSLIFLQRWWRGKMERLRYLRVKHLLCVVQRTWRVRLAAKNRAAAKIQSLARTVLAKRTAEKRKKAIVSIQSFWRGYCARQQTNTVKIRKARQRIRSANAKVTEPMKLCNRTRSALDYLLKCKNLTTVLGALVNLEVASRLSRKCTEQLVLDNALGVIFKVVRNSNRSLAYIELIKHALAIFVNVSKCRTTQGAVVTQEPDSLDTLVELACIFREKSEIFSRTCVLLAILCENEAIRQDLLCMEKAVSKIKSVYTITKRKHDLELKRNNANAKQRSLFVHTKNRTNHSTTTPLLAITGLVEILGLDKSASSCRNT